MQSQQLSDYIAEAGAPSVTTTDDSAAAVMAFTHSVGELAEQVALEARLLSTARAADVSGDFASISEEAMQTLNALKRITVEIDTKVQELLVGVRQLARTRPELAQRIALASPPAP